MSAFSRSFPLKATLSGLLPKVELPYRAKTTAPSNGSTVHKDLQLPFKNGELREAAMQTDHEFRENPHDGFVQTFESAEMDGNFAVEHSLLVGMATSTGHCNYACKHVLSSFLWLKGEKNPPQASRTDFGLSDGNCLD
jgi:hypothetical protein